MENNNFGIRDIFLALKKRWFVIAAIFILATVSAALYTMYFVTPIYAGSTKVSIGKPSKEDQSYNASDITNYNGLVDVFSEYIKSNDFVSKALEESNLDYNSRAVLSGIHTESGTSTPTITLVYYSPDAIQTKKVLGAINKYLTNHASDYIKNTGVRTVESVYVSDVPVSPNLNKNIFMGALAGFVIGVGLALVIDFANKKIIGEEDINRVIEVPVIGDIPRVHKKLNGLVSFSNDLSPISEYYRTLRTNIEYSSYDNKIKTILISSSVQGEGKTTVAANLAAAFANSSKKTLVIDCDLRNPSLHKIFRVGNGCGLSDVIVNKNTLKEAVKKINDNLYVLSAGRRTPNPSEMLGSAVMDNFLERVKDEYDLIIMDSPPVQEFTDAQVLSKKADGIIFIVKCNATKRNVIKKSKKLFDIVNSQIIGTVLTSNEKLSKSYLKKNYYKKRKSSYVSS